MVALGLLVLLVAAGTAIPADTATAQDLAAQLRTAREDFAHGNLDAAYARARAARTSLNSGADAAQSAWAQEFRLLEAEVLLWQAKRAEAVDVLACGRAEAWRSAPLTIRRKLLCSLAHLRLDKLEEADAELGAARRLALAAAPRLMGEVFAGEAWERRQQGRRTAALQAFRASLAVARTQHDAGLEALDLVNIGYLMIDLGRYSEAIDRLHEAELRAREIADRKILEIAIGDIGLAYDKLGDLELALHYFQDAQIEARAAGMPSAQADWIDDAGMEYYALGDLDAALDHETRALELARSVRVGEDIVDIEANIAFLLYQRGRFDAAREHSESSIAHLGEPADGDAGAWAHFVAALLDAGRQADDQAEASLSGVLRQASDPTLRADIENALARQCAERRRAGRAEQWFRRSIKTFEGRRAAVANEELRLAAFGNGEKLYKDYADFLVAAGRPDEALRALDHSRARTLDDGLGRAPRDAGAVRQGTPGDRAGLQSLARSVDGTLLFYSLAAKQSYLWVIAAQATRLFVLPGALKIQARVQAYQKTLQATFKSSDPLRDADPDAIALYRMLVEPAASMIPAGGTVYVIPDGCLNSLNFETLLVPAARGLHYWIEDVTLIAASSLRVTPGAVGEPIKAPAPSQLLLIGNPLSARPEFPALPDAEAEIERIVGHFPASERRVLTRAAAVPAAYAASDPGRFEYIHFVAHGTASRLSPLDSAVILSPPVEDAERFRLSARDILKYPLRARLVTISTCFGSGSRAYAGEGLVGLAWAFLRAGSERVISALWEADDDATPQLMDAMYQELQRGGTPAQALRSAKLALVHSSGKNRKPLYWAPFQLYAGS